MHADTPLNTFGTAPKVGGYGGAREGAGRKPSGYVKPQEAVDFDKARARSEIAKAERYERENLVAMGQLVSRAAVQQASATAYAGLAQTMRSISDNLERKGIPLEVCAAVEEVINAAMADHAKDMQLMAGTPEGDEG